MQGGRVIIVSDDDRWATSCAALLRSESFDVDITTGETFDAATVESDRPRVVVLDADLDNRSGRGLGMGLRSRFAVPLVMVTANPTEQQILTCYEAGADVVVNRNVGPNEFLARVRAMLRREADREQTGGDTIEVGDVVVRANERGAWVSGVWVHLTPFELAILRQVMLGQGRTVRRVTLLRSVWGPGRDARTLDVHLRSLRAKFEAVEGWRRIETVRGVGFRIVADRGDRSLRSVGASPDDDANEVSDEPDPGPLVLTP